MTHHGIIHAQSQFDGLTTNERALSQEMDERDRIIMELRASEARLLSIVERLAAIDGGAWHAERYERERARLIADARAAITAAKGTAS